MVLTGLAKLKAEHKAAAENRAKGHGELSEIVESEFLDAVTKSDKAIVVLEGTSA